MHLGSAVSDNGVSEKSLEFGVLLDGEVDASGDDSSLLHLLSSVAGKLEDLSGEVLEDGSEVDRSAFANSGGVSTFLKESGDSSDGEVKTSLLGSGLLLGVSCLAFCFSFCSCHF